MTAHTPGPWRIEYTGAFPMIVSRDGGKFDGSCICTEVCNGDANARLIAAAPELLKACKVARNYIDWMIDKFHPECGLDIGGMDKIIAKAEGRE